MLVLSVALEHGNVLHLPADLDESLVEFEAGVEVPSFSKGVYLLDLVKGFIAAASLLDPSEEHRVMKVPDGRRHELCQARVDDLLRLIVQVALEEVADTGNDHLLLITTGMQVAGVLFEEHDGVVEQLPLSSLIHKVVVSLEDRVVLYAVAEVLNSCRLHLLISDEDCKADEVKLPRAIDGEILVDQSPLGGDSIQQAKIRLHYLDYFSQMDLIEGEVAPEELVPCQDNINQLLDAGKGILTADDMTYAEGTIVQIPTELIALGCQVGL